MALLCTWIARIMDVPLGWLLALPRDATIVLVAAGTSLLLTLARKATTNQDQLARCRSDVRRIKERTRGAKRAKDKTAVKRHRATLAMVNAIRMKAEAMPLLVSILPILLLAVWAVERLDYLPPRLGEELTVRAYYPLGSIGRRTHLVPPEGAELTTNAVRLVDVDRDGRANGLATWTLRPTDGSKPLELIVRHEGETARHTVLVGRRSYAPPVVTHPGPKVLATEVTLERAKSLGVVPGIDAIAFPPWLVAYLILVIPLVPVLRRVLHVY